MRRIEDPSKFFDILDSIKGGSFVTIGYVTGANVDMPNKVKRKNPKSNRTKTYNDYTELNREEGSDIRAIVKLTTYNINYRNRQSVHDHYHNVYKPALNQINKEFGLPEVGTREGYKDVMNYGEHGQEVYNGKNDDFRGHSYCPQNLFKPIGIKSQIYAVGQDGKIIRELDKKEVVFKAKSEPQGVAALRKLGADDEKIKQYLKRVEELKFSYRNFEANPILYIIATVNGEKIAYINTNLQRTIEDVDINPQDFLAIVNEKYKQDLQENVKRTNIISLNETEFKNLIKESVNKILSEYLKA